MSARACVHVGFLGARVRSGARARRPVIEEIRWDEGACDPADAADALVYLLLLFLSHWDVTQ